MPQIGKNTFVSSKSTKMEVFSKAGNNGVTWIDGSALPYVRSLHFDDRDYRYAIVQGYG